MRYQLLASPLRFLFCSMGLRTQYRNSLCKSGEFYEEWSSSLAVSQDNIHVLVAIVARGWIDLQRARVVPRNSACPACVFAKNVAPR